MACLYAKACLQDQKLRKRHGIHSPSVLEPSESTWAFWHLDFRLLASRTVSEVISTVLNHPVCGTCLWQYEETHTETKWPWKEAGICKYYAWKMSLIAWNIKWCEKTRNYDSAWFSYQSSQCRWRASAGSVRPSPAQDHTPVMTDRIKEHQPRQRLLGSRGSDPPLVGISF